MLTSPPPLPQVRRCAGEDGGTCSQFAPHISPPPSPSCCRQTVPGSPVVFAELVVMLVPAVRQFDAALGQRAGRPVHGPRRQRRLVRRRAVGRRRWRTGTGLRRRHARLDTEHAVRIAEPCRTTTTAAAREHENRKNVSPSIPSDVLAPKRGHPSADPAPGNRSQRNLFFRRAGRGVPLEFSPLRESKFGSLLNRGQGRGGG